MGHKRITFQGCILHWSSSFCNGVAETKLANSAKFL